MCEAIKPRPREGQFHEHGELDRLPLDRLAQVMGSSSWQIEELCKIKMNLIFRSCRSLFLYAEQFACCNLYSYIDTQKLARENDARLGNDTGCSPVNVEPEEENATNQYGSGTVSPSRWLAKLIALNELKFGRHRRSRMGTTMARVYLAYYVISVILLTRSIYSQYKYDFYHYHLLRYQKAKLTSVLPSHHTAATSDNLDCQIANSYERHQVGEAELLNLRAQARAESTRSGSFLLDQAFFAESCYILMILLSLILYFGPVLYYRLIKSAYDFYFTRMLLDWDLEQVNCNQMIQRVVETVAKSSEIFMQISIGQLHSVARATPLGTHLGNSPGAWHKRKQDGVPPVAHIPRWPTSGGCAIRWRPIRPTMDELPKLMLARAHRQVKCNQTILGQAKKLELLYLLEHRWLEQRLKLMALGGHLQPLDRDDIDQIVGSLVMQLVYICLVVPGCYIWNICLFSSLPGLFKFSYNTSWPSIGSMFWLGGMNVALTYAGVYYFSTCLVYCKNQVSIVGKLQRMIDKFLQLNRTVMLARTSGCRERSARGRGNSVSTTSATLDMLMTIMSGEQRPNGGGYADHLLTTTCAEAINEYDLINSNLLLLVMHYKIFVIQLRHTKTTFSYLLMAAFILMFIFPILSRLHSPYLTGEGAKTLIIIVCLIMVGLPDMAVCPIAWSNARSSALYKNLASLLAHLIHWQSQLEPSERGFYNEHTVWLLQRELCHPENFHHQFAISAFGIEFSYKELLKIHFWLGLIIITFVVELGQSAPSSAGHGGGGDTSSFSRWLTDPLGITGGYE